MNGGLKNSIKTMQNYEIYLDESGSYGFDFLTEGTSRYYVICGVIINNQNKSFISDAVNQIRKDYFGNAEIKSSSIGNDNKKRGKILSELAKLDFSLIILTVDKQKIIKDSPLELYKPSFIKYFHREIYDFLKIYFPRIKIVEDEYGSSKFMEGYKEYVNKIMIQKDLFNCYDFEFANSNNSNLTQIADMIAGSERIHLENMDTPYVQRIFQKKIIHRIDFPKGLESFYKSQKEESSFDEQISQVSFKLARDFIDKNRDNEEMCIRMQVVFLKYLISKALNENDKYVYADEIISIIKIATGEDISRNMLYRKIVAKLRDQDVIISSCPSGYKLPTSKTDLQVYVEHTTSLVGPMMSRLGKCRKGILTITDGKLDILEDASLVAYKNYFYSSE